MIVILEGGDGSGKSTLCKQLVEKGFVEHHFERYSEKQYELWTNMIINNPSKQNIVIDRSFITDLVYRLQDGKETDNMNLQQMLWLLWAGSIKIVLCETDTSFEDGITRGEDNITNKDVAEEIKYLYRKIIFMFEKYAKINVFKYNWKKQTVDDVLKFIKSDFK